MRLAFIGSSLVSSYWNGAATYYRGLLGALARRGHAITFLEPDAFGRQQHRDIPDPEWARVVVWPADEAGMGRALETAAGHDVIVKASGVGVFDAELEGAVLSLRREGSIVAFWDVDAPATLESVEKDPDNPFRGLVPRYDLVLTYGGGDPVVRAYERLGARRCVPVYNALDPATHHPVQPDPALDADLGFLGNRLPDREARVEAFFLDAARRLPERSFLLGGAGWEDKALPANVRAIGHVPTARHNGFNCSGLAVLNVNRASMARYGFSPPTRVFEAAGAGACLISDAWEGIETFLEPGREVLVAQDGAKVAAHLAGLDRGRARAIGEAARRRVLAHHTYEQRAALCEAVLEGRGREAAA
ncbi:glycosyltransferase [Geminicoccaceae bacterium 1502E]|nr:glycosyltransferase [Geminicoccaceae bacterium 1502E]